MEKSKQYFKLAQGFFQCQKLNPTSKMNWNQLHHSFWHFPYQFCSITIFTRMPHYPLDRNLRGAIQPVKHKYGLDHNLEFSEHSWLLIFRNWQDQKMSVKLAHAIQSVKLWNKSAKEDMGTILFFAGRNWFHFGKKNNKTSRQENGMTWSCRLSITEVCGLQNPAVIT